MARPEPENGAPNGEVFPDLAAARNRSLARARDRLDDLPLKRPELYPEDVSAELEGPCCVVGARPLATTARGVDALKFTS
jgi:hypothetical protein